MEPQHNWNGIGNDVTGDDELDNILSILDFPMETLEADGFGGDWDASKSDYLGPIPSDVLMGPALVAEVKTEVQHPVLFPLPFAPPMSSNKVDLPERKVPLYQFSDSSSSSIPRQHNKCTEVLEQGVFQSQSPVSVLESSASSLASKTASLTKSRIKKRARSRRSRPLGNPWLLITPPVVPTSHRASATRKKPSRSTPQLPKVALEVTSNITGGAMKKCAHCEVTKTPQWREGPMGPKTLCNACGVRYRSGRLFPEYRPAASPTFVPAVHSNSHKKVLEMRNKAVRDEMQVTGSTP